MHEAAASATGWTTPVSLLASMSETSARRRSGREPALRARARSTTPSPVDRQCPRRPPAKPPAAASTEGCSIAETSRRSRPPRPASAAGVSASILASVPPEVNTTLRGSAPTSAATCSARLLDQAARGAALGMDRGRVAGQRRAPRARRRAPPAAAARSRSSRDRSASVMVLSSGSGTTCTKPVTPDSIRNTCFLPRIVLETARHGASAAGAPAAAAAEI